MRQRYREDIASENFPLKLYELDSRFMFRFHSVGCSEALLGVESFGKFGVETLKLIPNLDWEDRMRNYLSSSSFSVSLFSPVSSFCLFSFSVQSQLNAGVFTRGDHHLRTEPVL